MRCEWVSIIGFGLCVSFVPACNPLLRQAPSIDLSASQTKEPTDPSRAGASLNTPFHPDSANSAVKPAAGKDTMIEQARYPAMAAGPDLIPEPLSPAGVSAAQTVAPAVQGTETGSHHDAKAKPAEDPPLVEALRCYLDRRPGEAVAWLGRYDKSIQELLLYLLPLAVRLTQGDWHKYDSRHASAVLAQLDHVTDQMTAQLRPRAELSIKKMCFCAHIAGFGKYEPMPDSHGYKPGELVLLYVELQNLLDQRQDNAYSVHLHTTIRIRDFSGMPDRVLPVPDRLDISQSARHDFYTRYVFAFPKVSPGFHTLHVEIVDVPTGRKANQTLDFRVIPAYEKGKW